MGEILTKKVEKEVVEFRNATKKETRIFNFAQNLWK